MAREKGKSQDNDKVVISDKKSEKERGRRRSEGDKQQQPKHAAASSKSKGKGSNDGDDDDKLAVSSKKDKEPSRRRSDGDKKHQSQKKKQQQQKEQLKSKTMGVGLVIPSAPSSSRPNQKIVFNDDFQVGAEDDEEEVEEKTSSSNDHGRKKLAQQKGADEGDSENEDDDDDDDAVEEMTSNVARTKAMEQRAHEREEQRQVTIAKTRKRKTKTMKSKEGKDGKEEPEDKSDEEDDIDEEFLTQVDSLREEDKRKRKQKQEQPKHTIFHHQVDKDQYSMNVPTLDNPKLVDHNIQVVVLPDPSASATATKRDSVAMSIATTASSLFLSTAIASKEAMMYSRSRLVEGPPVDEKNRKSKNKHVKPSNKRKHELEAQQPLWKRSKQMRFIAVGTRHRTGMAAPLFAKKKSQGI